MLDVEQRVLVEQPIVVVRTETTVDGIPTLLGSANGASAGHAQACGCQIVGPPFARYEMLNGPDDGFAIEAGFPIAAPVDGADPVEAAELPGGNAAAAWHIGPYNTMEPTYAAIQAWIEERGGVPNGAAWEIYHSDPATEPNPATWRTEIVQPFIAAES
jgi:effector-binding domain-containing protein